MTTVQPLPAFTDNYLWLVTQGDEVLVVDPGDAAVVQRHLEAQALRLRAILVTHHHPDHTGGIAALRARWDVPVYGPRAEAAKIGELSEALDGGDTIDVLGARYAVLAVPGHTLGHIAFHDAAAQRLFCGDTLFSAGCGRLFEGTPAQMHASLQTLAALPDATAVHCTHEYTLSNLSFAAAVEPDNADLQARIEEAGRLRAAGRPTLPSTIGAEKRYNPFLRTRVAAVRAAAERQAGSALDGEVAVFAALRRWKDGFRG
ncbi:hydroxyacylglutathione hydrolase [Solimonas soli]|uniref:hydroxyacylglutathione hydrolase n=1 Tax=Solimonas soli TaxID=413479 RepID=UPI000483203B|nr:hydroxyacylglutathione hydrolase [Solimonas soli]